MDENLQELQAELERLRPAAPRPEFLARLEAELGPAQAAPRRERRPIRFWAAFPLAAAAALAVTARFHRAQADAAAPVLRPVQADDVLMTEIDEGYTRLADGTVAHEVQRTYLDTFTWKNPQTHASLTWSVPRREVQVLPATFE